MKKVRFAIFAAAAAIAGLTACTTTTTRTGYDMAQNGQTQLTYPTTSSDAAAVKAAMVSALRARGWNVTSTEYPITASISNRGQNAKVSITHENNAVKIETKGSTIGDTPYVPLRYVDFLVKTFNKTLK